MEGCTRQRVIPLFKKGKADNVDNCRPISVLPVVSKVLDELYIINNTPIFNATKFLALTNAVSESVIPLSGPLCALLIQFAGTLTKAG